MSVVPQLAHLRPTSSVGDSIVENRASLMMKDAEPQVWQAKRLCRITWRRHCARSPKDTSLQSTRFFTPVVEKDVGRSSSQKPPFHALR